MHLHLYQCYECTLIKLSCNQLCDHDLASVDVKRLALYSLFANELKTELMLFTFLLDIFIGLYSNDHKALCILLCCCSEIKIKRIKDLEGEKFLSRVIIIFVI